jgi:hypothetical protein
MASSFTVAGLSPHTQQLHVSDETVVLIRRGPSAERMSPHTYAFDRHLPMFEPDCIRYEKGVAPELFHGSTGTAPESPIECEPECGRDVHKSIVFSKIVMHRDLIGRHRSRTFCSMGVVSSEYEFQLTYVTTSNGHSCAEI